MALLNAKLNIIEYKPLKDVCSLGIGGPARYYMEARSIDNMREALLFCNEENLPFFILGKGSNCLFDDQGFKGLVINNKIDFCENPQPGVYHAGAGYSFSLLGVQTARQQWSGLEFASGIPCTVGGAVFMNAGANGAETCNALASVDFVTPQGELKSLKKEDLHFGYRTSSFQTMTGAIVGAVFALKPSSEARAKQLEIISYRTKTQPYSDKSAGCIFRNPANGAAGALIDKAGLKGTRIGGAEVSQMHANFLVNKGGATAKEFLELITVIKKRVQESSGVDLETEVRVVPYDGTRHHE